MKKPHRRGFVLVAAVLLIVLVGAAMGAISAAIVADARRTLDYARVAQLEQMLLAGAADAPAHLAAQAPVEGQSWNIELPASLGSQSAALQIHVGSVQLNGPATLHIRATLAGQHAEQAATFNFVNKSWVLVAAELDDQ